MNHAALRRADWRFLLPHARPASVMVQAAGALAGSASALPWLRPVQPGETAALVLAEAPDAARLADGCARLAAGGVHYAEWPVHSHRQLHAVLARLRAAGLAHVRVYWPWPSATAPRAWLLATPAIVAWYFGRAPRPARHPLRRAQWALRCGAARLAFAQGRFGAVATVAARERDPLPGWLAAARRAMAADSASSDGPLDGPLHAPLDAPADAPLEWALATGGDRAEHRVIGVVQEAAARTPRLVVKLARVPAAEQRLRIEHAALRHLPAACDTAFVGVPRPLHTGLAPSAEETAGSREPCTSEACTSEPCTIESHAPGAPLDSRLARGRLAGDLARATDWLIELACRTGAAGERHPRHDEMEQLLERAAAAFAPVLGRGLVERTRRLIRACEPLPYVCEHRDLAPWNVLVDDRGRWSVIDWEAAEPRGFPLLDLLYFSVFLNYAHRGTYHGAHGRATQAALLDPRTREGRRHALAISRYCSAVALGDDAVRALRALHWPLHSLSEHRRMCEDHGTPGEAVLRRSRLVPLWELELRALGERA